MAAPTSWEARDLAEAFRAAARALAEHRDRLNALNVYPVPDGDTGTNMALTLRSVVEELDALGPEPAMGEVCTAAARGSLMGARGNSGVILSQLVRGIAQVAAEAERLGGEQLAEALATASRLADEAVLRPVEGTVLSVARAAAEGARRAAGQAGPGLAAVLAGAREAAAEALARTPEQLPVLRAAGVVDAGGAGFLLLLDAWRCVADGTPVPPPPARQGDGPEAAPLAIGADLAAAGTRPGGDEGAEGHSELRYEVMYLLEAPDEAIEGFREVWAGLGDSIVVVGGEGLWNCHIHTDDVGPAIEAALDVGRPRDIRVTDLREQVEELRWVQEQAAGQPSAEPSGTPPRTAVVAVCAGEGIRRIFRSLGVRHFVTGGQAMNPSTQELLAAVQGSGSAEVVLLPNNENVHPVALQVAALADRPVKVVPTSSIVEGFAALLEYDPEAGAEENARLMAASARRVVPGAVVQAVRASAEGPGGPIRAGDWLGLSRDGVAVVGTSLFEAASGLLGKLVEEGHELVTIIEGEGASAAESRRLSEWLAEAFPGVAVEVHHGGQPVYPYLFGVE
ncbi:DAK2 domain-containing protein [Aciditerrimonas ferrireducens]|nr:DAK2 domain-containing protein [Aciditerrimonas ferrireducens]MCK4177955.1 DAK2 domain-containing protein [Aciditerrimonas ferrireducens]